MRESSEVGAGVLWVLLGGPQEPERPQPASGLVWKRETLCLAEIAPL